MRTLVLLALSIPLLIYHSDGSHKKTGSVSGAQNPTTGKMGGSVWYHSANLLQNPEASSTTVNPPWTQNTGTWIVQSGPAVLGPNSIDSSNASPWFLNTGIVIANGCSTCFSTQTYTLVQTVNLSVPTGFFKNYVAGFEYGGDAFAEGNSVGSGPSGYHASPNVEAIYTLDFLDSAGHPLVNDTSGPTLNLSFGCVLGSLVKGQNYGYRRTVGGVPNATRFVRFTATIKDQIAACNNSSTTGTFKNGFDNLWLVIWVLGPQTAANVLNRSTIGPFERGSGPIGPIMKANLTSKPAVNRHPRQ